MEQVKCRAHKKSRKILRDFSFFISAQLLICVMLLLLKTFLSDGSSPRGTLKQRKLLNQCEIRSKGGGVAVKANFF